MGEPFRPRRGRWPLKPRVATAVGWVVVLLLVAGAGRLAPGLSRRLDAANGARESARGAAATETMRRAEAFLHAERDRLGVHAEGEASGDPTGLIGGEVTPLMTTLGSLEAKRIATNPEWAGVLTRRLAGAGIGAGDLVGAGFSGSFPGLNLALALACEALEADLVAVSSVTASTWGANQPGFTWPEMEARLMKAGILRRVTVAVTAGGDADMALDLEAGDRAVAYRVRDSAARGLGVPILQPRDFGEAVGLRMRTYRRAANGRPIALYVNVGGADASLGRSDAFLRLRSGFLPARPFGLPRDQGVAARLAGEGVRVLMLLNVRDLALRWGVPLTGGARTK
jgi:poly-gamma-glutamate system protein